MIRPIGSKIVVRPDAAETVTEQGIVLTERSKSQVKTGTVIAAGAGETLSSGAFVPTTLCAGDRVIFSPYGGEPYHESRDDTVIVMDERDVLAVIEGE